MIVHPKECKGEGVKMYLRLGSIGIALALAVGTPMIYAQATNTFPASGSVGIGTTKPQGLLDVNGGSVFRGYLNIYYQGTIFSGYFGSGSSIFTAGANGQADLGMRANGDVGISAGNATTPQFILTNTGNVGIGTTAPQASLTVAGTIAGRTANGYPGTGAGYYALTTNNTDSDDGGLTIQYLSAGVLKSGMSLIQNGNVGIGTTSPGAMLEVKGNIKLTANSGASITFQDGSVQSVAYTGVTCGGDYAESVDVAGARRAYGPGDLLVIDPEHPGEFLKSAAPYSTSVTGIYSTKPGTVGRRQTGPKSPDEVPMAMIGIVPAKVSAENGSIHPGDLLVTSSTLGYAMKGTDRTRMLGAVIGKALGNLEEGKGVIEVVVTLQ